MTRRQFLHKNAAMGASLAWARVGASVKPPGRRHLLLDSRIIAQAGNAKLAIGTVQKHPANPLFREDRPWEVRFDNLYANVIFDPASQLYRCWYSPFIVDPAVSGTPPAQRETVRYRALAREMGVCYAESRDGLRWEKPELGLVEFAGGKANNLVARGPHGAGVMCDPGERDPARRFKMFCRAGDKAKTMAVAFSPDGLRWGELQPCPEIKVPGDTHNQTLWSPETGRYVGFTRLKTDQRLTARTESTDYLHWTKAVEVLRGDVRRQTYSLTVFRHAGVYLGLVTIFDTAADRVSCELAWSPDTLAWERIEPGRAFISNSPQRGEYDWGCVYPAAAPVFHEGEIRIYYGASNGPHTGWRDGFLALATLRPDGFAGYEQATPDRPGLVTTNPILCTGRRLRVSADAKRGRLRVAVADDGRLGFDRCHPLTADVTDGAVEWAGGEDLSRHLGRPIQLQFELNNTKLYAFIFTD